MLQSSKKTNFSFLLLFVVFLCTSFASSLFGQVTTPIEVGHTMFKHLQRDSILKLTFTTDTRLLINKKYKEEWQPITINLEDKSGQALEWDAKVRTRGNIRKKVCYYPPIKLKFKKKWLVENGMDSTFNDLKVVIGCRKGDSYGNLVLKELLAYRLYEELTSASFRTQLAEIKFIDSNGKGKPFTTYAFIIENEDEMATRLNAKCAKPKRLRSKYIQAEQLDKMTLFEYMIGNTDWSAVTSHNVRIIKCKDYRLPLPVAYDFDYCGLVNAPYAVHGEGINLEEITQRLYLGMCRKEGVLERQIPLFMDKKAAFYKHVNSFTYLPKKERAIIIKYLDGFYEILDNPRRFKRNISDLCREHGR